MIALIDFYGVTALHNGMCTQDQLNTCASIYMIKLLYHEMKLVQTTDFRKVITIPMFYSAQYAAQYSLQKNKASTEYILGTLESCLYPK